MIFNHTDNSFLLGFSKPEELVKKAISSGSKIVGITDNNLCGSYDFWSACKGKIKPVIGLDITLIDTQANVLLLAKNYIGWQSLIKISSKSYHENLYDKKNDIPNIDFDSLSQSKDGLICIMGYLGSELAKLILCHDINAIYSNETDIKTNINKNWVLESICLINKYKNIYKDIFLAVDNSNRPVNNILNEGMKYLSKKTSIPCISLNNSFYINKEDSSDQRILLCSKFKCKLSELNDKVANSNVLYAHLLNTSNDLFLKQDQSEILESLIESYNIKRKPLLPHFENDNEHLEKLVNEGIKKIKLYDSEQVYQDRIKLEMQVFKEANLAGYFLIVQDYANWCRNQGWLLGASRGSVAGSLVAYIIGITRVDPIRYDLLFERFYNVGRNTEGNISLPDIDLDFPVEKRGDVLAYLKNKYGVDKVAQMSTFGTLQGRGAVKEVLNAHNVCSFSEINKITEHIPDEAAISDKLEEMKKDGEASIIKWALLNNKKELAEWVTLTENGCEGKYGKFFEQAMRIEGVKKSTGKHAAGVVICSEVLESICPMIKDKSSDGFIVGVDMDSAKSMGLVKFDILGVAILDKLMKISELLKQYE